jgi:hypothetical protein
MNAQITLQRLETNASSRQHGILQINVDDTDTNAQRETTIIVVVDLSGSMDDQGASSGKSRTRESKLDQLKFVLKNILRFIANNTNGNVWFTPFLIQNAPSRREEKGVSAKGATVRSILSPLRTLPLRVKRCKLHRPKRK